MSKPSLKTADTLFPLHLEPSDKFENFWKKYPKREAKAHALKAWIKLGIDRNEELYQEVMAGVEAQLRFNKTWKAAMQGDNEKREYIKLPATWLNAGCWEDEIIWESDKKKERRTPVNAFKRIGFKSEADYLKFHTEKCTIEDLRIGVRYFESIGKKFPKFLYDKAGLKPEKKTYEIPW